MQVIRILIVDDHTVVRDGLSAMLDRERDFTVVGEARDGLEAVYKAGVLSPDVVLMDLRMPRMDGVEAMRRIGEKHPDVRFIVLTTCDTDEYIFDAIEAGAKGIPAQGHVPRRAVPGGSGRPSWGVADRARRSGQDPGQTGAALPPGRRAGSPRRALGAGGPGAPGDGEGGANKEIAASLSISERAVKTHVTNIFHKLDVNHRTEAVTRALQNGIIKL